MINKFLISTAVLLASSPAISAAPTPLSNPNEKFSYAMGYRTAMQLQKKLEHLGMEIHPSTFQQGIEDALSGAQPQLSAEEIDAVIQVQQTRQFVKQAAAAMTNKRVGDSFRKTNRAKDGVLETASGLQYRVLDEGAGKHPEATDTVVVHYRGTFVNGEEFDSSYARGEPSTFVGLDDGVIAGWREALLLMQEGARWKVVIPPDLAYGAEGSDEHPIGPNETLIFEIELISVK